MRKFVLPLLLFIQLISCSQKVEPISNTQKMYHSDSTKFATVTIDVLDSASARGIKDLMYYYKGSNETIFDDYSANSIFDLILRIDIENNFGGSINNVFDLGLSCDINGIEKKLFEYDLIASSNRLSRHLGYFYELDNAEKVTLIVKPEFFLVNRFIPNYKDLEFTQQMNKENEFRKKVLGIGQYDLVYKMIVEPGIEGITDFTVSKAWVLYWDKKDNKYKTRIK